MNYVSIIQSINKVAIIAFFAIVVLIVVEVSMMMKGKGKKETVKIPDFDPKFGEVAKGASTKTQLEIPGQKKSMIRMLIISSLLLILFGLMAVFGNYMLINQKTNDSKTPDVTPQPQIELVNSEGILIFNSTWQKIQLKNIPVGEGEVLYIGVATVKGTDIDKARIKINKKDWGIVDEVKAYNKDKGVFYMQYTIATDESSLKIDAQLHSKEDGWLAE